MSVAMLRAQPFDQVQNQLVVERDRCTFLEEVVVARDSEAIGNVSSFAVQALRRVVSGMRRYANPRG